MKKLFLLSLIFTSTSHANPPCNTTSKPSFPELNQFEKLSHNFPTYYSLDESALRPWDSNSQFQCEPPFKVTFHKDNKTIIFLAVHHVSGLVEPAKSDLIIMKQEIEKNKPQGVLIESVTGTSIPAEEFKSIQNSCYQDNKFSCGEAAYSALIANSVHAEVLGGEPIPFRLNQNLYSKLRPNELFAFRSTQAILNLKRQGIKPEEWATHFNLEISQDIKFDSDEWSYSKYQDWLLTNLKSLPTQIEANWLEPRNDKEANLLQMIASKIEKVREPLILRNAEQLINKHDSTMIIYGDGHFYKELPVYEKAFGEPSFQCLKQTH